VEVKPDCVEECILDHNAFEPGCILELVELTECVAALDCTGFDTFKNGDPFDDPDYPCKTVELAVFACAE
jgi:hypothetical protein